ncbi:MAG: helix-turn-helix transcriptional regulator [Planctomycetota bacterium]
MSAPSDSVARTRLERPDRHDAPLDMSDSCITPGVVELTRDERRYLADTLAPLSPREVDVVLAVCVGGSNDEIADRLFIALATLRTHLMRINQKLGTTSKSDIVRLVTTSLLEGYRTGRLSAPDPVLEEVDLGDLESVQTPILSGF